jgi:glycine/D-amino acid oxidase-like deaminating enzyme
VRSAAVYPGWHSHHKPDPSPSEHHIYVAAGHAMLGYTIGPITGKLISEMITGKPFVSGIGTAEVRSLFLMRDLHQT